MNVSNVHLVSRFFLGFGSVCALCACLAGPALAEDPVEGAENQVDVSDYNLVTLAVKDTDLAQVLELLAIQSQKNIVTSKNVSGTISANLFDVTFEEALDAILEVNGYTWAEDGNFIYVRTEEEAAAIIAAQRKTEARVFELEYLSAADANEMIAPLLSEDGRASYRGDVEPGFEPGVDNGGAEDWAFVAMLVVNDYAENLDDVAALVGRLDTPPQQVLVEATIVQTTLDEANAFGIDFSVVGSVDFTDFTDPLSGVNNLLNGDNDANGFQPADNSAKVIDSTPGNTSGPGTFKVGYVSDSVSVFLKLLDEVTDNTILARPKIMCLNRQRAAVHIGAKVGYLSTTATETSTTQTVEYLDTGIMLVFRPFISSNGMIRLELAPSVSEASLRNVTDVQGVSVTIPDELTNELTTNVRIHDGKTLVLGGLFRESTQVTRRQVPVLGDIPILGAAFKGQDDVVQRDEIMFLITPSVVHDESLWELGDDAMAYSDQVRLGARQGLLLFSREKTTTNYNARAFDAHERGDVKKALMYVNISLRLNPTQAGMIEFRQNLLGVKESPYEGSLMERTFRNKLGYFNIEGMSGDASSADTGFATVAFTQQQKDRFTDQFLHEYFNALSLPEYSPYGVMTASEQAELWPYTAAGDMGDLDHALVEATEETTPIE